MKPTRFSRFWAEQVVAEAFLPNSPLDLSIRHQDREELEELLATCSLWQLVVRWRILNSGLTLVQHVSMLKSIHESLYRLKFSLRQEDNRKLSDARQSRRITEILDDCDPGDLEAKMDFPPGSPVYHGLVASLKASFSTPKGRPDHHRHARRLAELLERVSIRTRWQEALEVAAWLDVEVDRQLRPSSPVRTTT